MLLKEKLKKKKLWELARRQNPGVGIPHRAQNRGIRACAVCHLTEFSHMR